MRNTLTPLNLLATFLLAAILVGGGCGDDEDTGGGGTPPLPCAISNVRTDLAGPYQSGDAFNIRWDSQGDAATVLIELLKGGAVSAPIVASTANDGYYPWTLDLGDLASDDDYGIRVTAIGETGCAGEMNDLEFLNVVGCELAFTITATDTLIAGESYTVNWTGTHTSGHVDIELWIYPFGSASEFVEVVAANVEDTGTWDWNPVDSFNRGTYNYYRLRILDVSVDGCEALTPLLRIEDATVCTAGVGRISQGQITHVGDMLVFDIEQSGGSGFVDLMLFSGDTLVPNGYIDSNVPVGLGYSWTVSRYSFTGEQIDRFSIKAVDVNDRYCEGFSERFTIE